MPYAPQSKIEKAAGGAERLVEIADWNNDGAVDADAIALGQDRADRLIDMYCGLRYGVPYANAPASIVELAAESAVYFIKESRGTETERDVEKHTDRVKLLKDIGKGVARPSDPAPPKSTAVRSEAVVNNRDVSRANLKGLI